MNHSDESSDGLARRSPLPARARACAAARCRGRIRSRAHPPTSDSESDPAYMRKWDEKDARKAHALRKSSERARWEAWKAWPGGKRPYEHHPFSLVSQTRDEDDAYERLYASRRRASRV